MMTHKCTNFFNNINIGKVVTGLLYNSYHLQSPQTIVIIHDSVPLPFIAIEKLLLFYEHSKEIEFIGLKYSCNKSYINIFSSAKRIKLYFWIRNQTNWYNGPHGRQHTKGWHDCVRRRRCRSLSHCRPSSWAIGFCAVFVS